MKREIRIPGLAFLIVVSFSAASCGSSPNASGRDSAGQAASIEVDGWKSVETISNSALTKFDGTGHFDTSRNACGQAAFGGVSRELWSRIAPDLNEAVHAPMLDKAACTDLESYSKLDGPVDLVLEDGKKIPIFEHRTGWEVCSRIKDPELVKRLNQDLVDLVLAADKEECAHGWGRS